MTSERQAGLWLASLVSATGLMVLVGCFGSRLGPIPVIAAILSMAAAGVVLCTLWVRQMMAGTKTDSQTEEEGRSWLNWMVTVDGYDWRIVLGLGGHLVALWWLGPLSKSDPVGFIGVGIGGLYFLLLVTTRCPEQGYSRR